MSAAQFSGRPACVGAKGWRGITLGDVVPMKYVYSGRAQRSKNTEANYGAGWDGTKER